MEFLIESCTNFLFAISESTIVILLFFLKCSYSFCFSVTGFGGDSARKQVKLFIGDPSPSCDWICWLMTNYFLKEAKSVFDGSVLFTMGLIFLLLVKRSEKLSWFYLLIEKTVWHELFSMLLSLPLLLLLLLIMILHFLVLGGGVANRFGNCDYDWDCT